MNPDGMYLVEWLVLWAASGYVLGFAMLVGLMMPAELRRWLFGRALDLVAVGVCVLTLWAIVQVLS
jgi:hypothetical protein